MTPKLEAFMTAYLSNGRDGAAAYRSVYGRNGPWKTLLQLKGAKQAIEDHDNPPLPVVDRLPEIDVAKAKRLVQDYEDIYTADPRALITHRRVNCRHCHGVDHSYRWVDMEEFVERARQMVLKGGGSTAVLPDPKGGVGFRHNDPVDPDCPKCLGEGVSDIFISDFTKLDAKTLKLLAGVKMTKDGLQVLMHDQMHARDMHAKILGLLIDRTKSEDAPPPPAPVALTPEQIADLAKSLGNKY